jgi:hypothetical protein
LSICTTRRRVQRVQLHRHSVLTSVSEAPADYQRGKRKLSQLNKGQVAPP